MNTELDKAKSNLDKVGYLKIDTPSTIDFVEKLRN